MNQVVIGLYDYSLKLLKNKLFPFILCSIFIPSLTFSAELNSTAEEILKDLAPVKNKLELVPIDFIFDSKKHKYKTERFIKGDFNKDGNPDIAICAIELISPGVYNGYLLIGTFVNNKWSLAFSNNRQGVSGPSLKMYKKEDFLLFFASYSSSLPPEKIQWNASKKEYYFEVMDFNVL